MVTPLLNLEQRSRSKRNKWRGPPSVAREGSSPFMPDWFLSVAEGSADRLHEPKTLLTSLPIINTGQRRAFFNMLRTELAFYMGCLNLHARLAQTAEPVCFPVPAASAERRHSFSGLYDVCLNLNMEKRVVPLGQLNEKWQEFLDSLPGAADRFESTGKASGKSRGAGGGWGAENVIGWKPFLGPIRAETYGPLSAGATAADLRQKTGAWGDPLRGRPGEFQKVVPSRRIY